MPDGVQTSATTPDAADVQASEWPMRALGEIIAGKRTSAYQAVVRKSVADEIHEHGKSITSVEICGVLVGNVFHDENGPYLHIHGSIRGDRATGHAAQVTFTAETWSAIQAVMDRDFPDDRIVGWYHTHPQFGIFLSGMDLFIQDNFFNLPWQVALVYDPIGGDEGMFFWKAGKTDRQDYLIEADPAGAPVIAPVQAALESPAMALSESVSAPATAAVATADTVSEPTSPAARPSLFARPESEVPQSPADAEPAPPVDPAHNIQPEYQMGPAYEPPAPDFDPSKHVWAGTQALRGGSGFRIPIWLIGAVVFVGSFGLTLWAMYNMQGQEVVLPHAADHSTQKPLAAPSTPSSGASSVSPRGNSNAG